MSFSERAIAKLRARSTPVQSWFLDLNLVLGYWQSAGKRTYHHTAPINPMYGLHEALVILQLRGKGRGFHPRYGNGLQFPRPACDTMSHSTPSRTSVECVLSRKKHD